MKWIAGSPDHEDHDIISSKINNILQNNNNQVLINKLTIDKIIETTNITNNIIKNIQNEKYKYIEIDSFSQWKYKLEIIKEVLNIAYAIHWTKANIINPFILSNEELDMAR